MAEKRGKQSEWPIEQRTPIADFVTPTGYLRSGRPIAGPLRMGTAPGVGPNGLLRDGNASDYGMDRVNYRKFDPIGTPCNRWPQEEASLLSREIRSRGDKKNGD